LIRVLVVAESALAGTQLAEIVGDDARLNVVGTASPSDLSSRIAELRPDVVLGHRVDTMSDADAERIPYVLLLDEGEAGSSRDASPAEIVAAVVAAAAGIAVAQPLRRVRSTAQARLAEPLTPRERAVLQQLARGYGNRAIAAELHISEHTVKFHVASILAKLDAGNRAEAVSRGVKLGLLML